MSNHESANDDENIVDDGEANTRISSLAAYHAARTKLDEAVQKITAVSGTALSCQKGCAQCCVGGLEVLPVEVAALEIFLEEEGLASIPIFQEERCPFLDAEEGCSIYEARPFVCRTQGLALRMDDCEEELVRFTVDDKKVAACALNFQERTPAADDILDLTTVQALLTLVNGQFCETFALSPLERLPLAGVAQMVRHELISQGILQEENP